MCCVCIIVCCVYIIIVCLCVCIIVCCVYVYIIECCVFVKNVSVGVNVFCEYVWVLYEIGELSSCINVLLCNVWCMCMCMY